MKPYYSDDAVTIYHGDCREVLPHVEADVVVTDPPYGIAYASGWHGKFRATGIEGDGDECVRDAVLEALGGLPMLVFGSWRSTPPPGTRTALVWDKGPAFGMGDLSIPWKCSWEMIYVIGSGFNGRRDEGVLRGHTVVTWSGGPGQRQHPTEKPVTLLVSLIQKCPTGTVLDPFMGGGSTLRAAKDLGRRAIGIEVEEGYCEIAAKRCAQEVLDLGAA